MFVSVIPRQYWRQQFPVLCDWACPCATKRGPPATPLVDGGLSSCVNSAPFDMIPSPSLSTSESTRGGEEPRALDTIGTFTLNRIGINISPSPKSRLRRDSSRRDKPQATSHKPQVTRQDPSAFSPSRLSFPVTPFLLSPSFSCSHMAWLGKLPPQAVNTSKSWVTAAPSYSDFSFALALSLLSPTFLLSRVVLSYVPGSLKTTSESRNLDFDEDPRYRDLTAKEFETAIVGNQKEKYEEINQHVGKEQQLNGLPVSFILQVKRDPPKNAAPGSMPPPLQMSCLTTCRGALNRIFRSNLSGVLLQPSAPSSTTSSLTVLVLLLTCTVLSSSRAATASESTPTSTPESLLNRCLFYLALYCLPRGGEYRSVWWSEMQLKVNRDGQEFQGGHHPARPPRRARRRRLQVNATHRPKFEDVKPNDEGVKVLEKALFLLPNTPAGIKKGHWYRNKALGKDGFRRIINKVIVSAKLVVNGRRIVHHSFRTSAITGLMERGVHGKQVRRAAGTLSPSLKNYVHQTDDLLTNTAGALDSNLYQSEAEPPAKKTKRSSPKPTPEISDDQNASKTHRARLPSLDETSPSKSYPLPRLAGSKRTLVVVQNFANVTFGPGSFA
ncbi:hypothetical protein BDK51DRAFT_45374 [Blyttiomyces helicus]|uniref:Uncharacterized protein n=1 Tax=Blyttiomyces helicus TaxID=388810 RepID=A0A4P9WBN6_9FUNG|nr:hypothetical protein BDK51DRAFT_45374 [Blyttiomyces helicus]|eukprot:RKO88973.1 hypothetical protein BDK51DRAFT_45374 [Blyttiomyces helicus]